MTVRISETSPDWESIDMARVINRGLNAWIQIHRHNVWVSELSAIVWVAITALAFTVCAATILGNERSLLRQHRTIVQLSSDQLRLSEQLAVMEQKVVVAEALMEYTRGRLSAVTLSELVNQVYDNSARFGYDPLLLVAVIHVESFARPTALGRNRSGALSGALGLMQLKFETAREVGSDLGIELKEPIDLLKPEINIPIGVAYLTRLVAQFHSLKLGVLAYNLGPGVVYQTLSAKQPLPLDYYAKVLRAYFALKKAAEGRVAGR
jgi:hypothetical protein